jgi:NNP family nitrate/nitrite transporter-like MFS transporter
MNLREFRRIGHWPSLLCAFLYFDISFMVWMLVGAMATVIAKEFGLSHAQKGLLVAVPPLGGALLRLVLGVLTDRFGARRTGLLGLMLTLVPLTLGWLWSNTFPELLAVALLLGVAGASFAAALPLASRWYPPQYQGLAMGIAGAGNSGTAIATLLGPALALSLGWHAVFGLALIPVLLTLLVFALFAKDSPNQPPPRPLTDYLAVLKQADTWWFNLFYLVTFGGFVGLASYLTTFFKDHYQVGDAQAGYLTALCVIAGSLLRPVGGYLADRLGGIRLLMILYSGVGLTMLSMATLPPLVAGTILLFLGTGMLGMGNGAVFQLVPQRFPREIGVVTGIVGAAGGFGGFLLPKLFGELRQRTETFANGFWLFALVALGCAVGMTYVARIWQGRFVGKSGVATAVVEVSPSVSAPSELEVSTEPARA